MRLARKNSGVSGSECILFSVALFVRRLRVRLVKQWCFRLVKQWRVRLVKQWCFWHKKQWRFRHEKQRRILLNCPSLTRFFPLCDRGGPRCGGCPRGEWLPQSKSREPGREWETQPDSGCKQSPFPDVPKSHWDHKDIEVSSKVPRS